VARDEQQKEPASTWSRNASLLISEASNNESAASLQALRRLFAPWEQQLLNSPKIQSRQRPLATLICLRELLTRFYRVRHEFDQASPPPAVLPIKTCETPDFNSLSDDDGDYGVRLLADMPGSWLQTAGKKFVVQQQHCDELKNLFQRYFDATRIREAIQEQSDTLRSIESNLGHDSAIKALLDDDTRKTLAPLASKKTLTSDAFKEMLAHGRKNYDNLTIDGDSQSFAVEGCSFRHTHFRHISLDLEGCALHNASFDQSTLLRLVHDCEFGKQAKSLHIDYLRGNYAGTHFDQLTAKIIYPGSQLGHISNSHIAEFGGNVKFLDRCRVDTLRGICLKTTDSFIERAVRARFGAKIKNLRCAQMTDCQFGSRVIEGIASIKSLHGSSFSDLTFVNTAFDSIEKDAVLFRLRGCLVQHLHGTVATLERCRIKEIHPDAQIHKVITSQIGHLAGGRLRLCGTHEEQPQQQKSNSKGHPQQCTHITLMSAGSIEHLNGVVDKLDGGAIGRLGFEKDLRLSTVRRYITEWRDGSIDQMSKGEFLVREKEMLRQETIEVAKAIRSRTTKGRKRRTQPDTKTPPAVPNRSQSLPTKAADSAAGDRHGDPGTNYKTIDISPVSKFRS